MTSRFLIVAAVLLSSTSVAAAAGLRIGRAAVDITPVLGAPMLTPQRPPFEMKLAGEPHDPIHVKAIVIEQGDTRVAIVECDLTNIPQKMIQEARKIIGETTKVPADHVLLAATHCHTAPQLRPRFLGKYDDKAKQLALDYIATLPGKIAESAKLAEQDLQPAHVAVAVAKEDSVSFNRRYFLRDGTVLTNPFKGEDEKLGQVLRPAGPTDPEIGIVDFENEQNQPLAIMSNFSLHLDTMGGDKPSADFPFMVEEMLKSALGPQTLSLWASGASGNINHYYLMDPMKFHRTKGPQESSRIGAILGAAILKAFPNREPVRDTPLRVARETVRLDYHPEKAAALLARMKNTPHFSDDEVDVFNDNGKLTFDAEVLVIALGDELAWVSMPGEMFVEFGLTLKNASPFRHTMIHSLANGAIGYVPNMKAYPEGSYEALATRCAPGSGEKLVETATKLLVRLKNADRPPTVVQQARR